MKLYRFGKIDDKRTTSLEQKLLWYSAPTEFNDLADCSFNVEFRNIRAYTRMAIEQLLDTVSKPEFDHSRNPLLRSGADSAIRAIRAKYDVTDDNTRAKAWFALLAVETQLSYLVKDGTAVCCFFGSEPHDALMWAHYGDNHRGMCVEYEIDTKDERVEQELFRVIYVSQRINVCPFELLFTPASAVINIITAKSANWTHENEYRMVRLSLLSKPDKLGIAIPIPQWLRPTRIIKGCRVDLNEPNWRVTEVAARLGIKLARANPPGRDGLLSIEDLWDYNPGAVRS